MTHLTWPMPSLYGGCLPALVLFSGEMLRESDETLTNYAVDVH